MSYNVFGGTLNLVQQHYEKKNNVAFHTALQYLKQNKKYGSLQQIMKSITIIQATRTLDCKYSKWNKQHTLNAHNPATAVHIII